MSILLITALILALSILENFMIIDEQLNQILRIIENNHGLIADIDDDYFSKDAIYATRYFTVTFDQSDSFLNVDLSKISAIDEAAAKKMALNALSTDKSTGYINFFKFKKINNENDVTYIFLDASLQMQNLKLTSEATIVIYMIGMIVLCGVLMSISGYVLKPVTENIKKQKQFVTNAGHELKTPLAIITADVDVLELELGDDNEWIASIRNQTERLNRLIQSLLSLSKYDYAALNDDYEITCFNLSELILEEIGNFKAMAVNKTIICDNITPNIFVRSEIDNIRQLIGLFLDNAIKYTPENKDIRISVEKSNKKITMTFENHYDVTKKINTKRIFERFYRGDKSHDKSIQGYGIGLSIVLSIVERYKGKIRVLKKEDTIKFVVTFTNKKRRHFEIQ